MEDLIQKISFLSPEESETIVLTMKPSADLNADLAQVGAMMPYLQQHFPNNKIIAIPHTLELNSMDTEALILYLQQGDKGSVIEEQS